MGEREHWNYSEAPDVIKVAVRIKLLELMSTGR